MSCTLLRGSFVIRYPDLPRQGPEPDGDTVKFLPDTPALVEGLPRRSGRPPDINARGISVRLEAIDALETHFEETHQELTGANTARDELLRLLGFTNVRFFADLPNKIESADLDTMRGHVLSNGVDANGRLIAFVYPGEHPGPDGAAVFVDEPLVDQSVNARLLAAGNAYPAFYATLPATLRTHLADVSRAARDAQPPTGLWPRSTADPNAPATVADLTGLQQLVIWPKLFRRIVPYLLRRLAARRSSACSCWTGSNRATCTTSSTPPATRSSSPCGPNSSSSAQTPHPPAPDPAHARPQRATCSSWPRYPTRSEPTADTRPSPCSTPPRRRST